MKTIKFYRVGEEYGNFSNFAPYKIFINNEVWATVEHFFQSSKFDDSKIKRRIQLLKTAKEAAREGRNHNYPLRKDWEQIKDSVMKRALSAKFLQHHHLKFELLETENAYLIEHTSNDDYWGDGGDGSGLNKLGKLLMEVRNEVRNILDHSAIVFPPWIAFPDIDQSDMFWRMGIGESYLELWDDFYINLSDKESYKLTFPEKIGWERFYD